MFTAELISRILEQITNTVLLFHCTEKGAKTKLHQEYFHRKKRIPLFSSKLVFFANRNTPKNMQLLDEIHTVFTATLSLMNVPLSWKKTKTKKLTPKRFSIGLFKSCHITQQV